jgi:hypothetical protein
MDENFDWLMDNMSIEERLATPTPLISTVTSAGRVFEIYLTLHRRPHLISLTGRAVLNFIREEFGYDEFCNYCHLTVTSNEWCLVNTAISQDWVDGYLNGNTIITFDSIHIQASWRFFTSSHESDIDED